MKKTALLLIISSNIILAIGLQDKIDDIVLTDDTKNSLRVQENIIGCDDTAKKGELKCSKSRTPEDRDRDIENIKNKLNDILKQLAEITKEKNNNIKDTKIATIKNSIKKLTGEDIDNSTNTQPAIKEIKVIEEKSDYVIIEVQSGECLSKYAQKYYGDSRKYHKIYKANQDKIGKDLQVFIGDRLIVPTSNSYKYKTFNKKTIDINITKKVKKEIKVKVEKEIIQKDKIIPNIVKIKPKETNNSISLLDKAVFVGDEDNITKPKIEKKTNSDFIPLDENIEKNRAWIETKIENGINIYQIAEQYYGAKTEYYHIYEANKNIIGKDFKLKNGMLIKIPITKNFREKPTFINLN